MSYVKDAKKLEALVERALDQAEFQAQLGPLGTAALAKLHRIIDKQQETIWDAAHTDIERFEDLERKLERDQAVVESTFISRSWPTRLFVNVFCILVPGALIVDSGVFLLSQTSWGYLTGWLAHEPLLAAALSLKLVLALVVIWLIHRRLMRRESKALRATRDSAVAELGIEGTKAQLEEMESVVQEAVLEHGITRALRRTIAKFLTPSFGTAVDLSSIEPNLSGRFSPLQEVPTESHQRLQFMLSRLRGGSLGIAGPRGAGKTTLINSVCHERVAQIAGRPALCLATSAPVEFESRDFILHLFAGMCHAVLKRDNPHYNPRNWQWHRTAEQVPAVLLFRMVVHVAAGVLMLGALLWGLGFDTGISNVRSHRVAQELAAARAARAHHPAAADEERSAVSSEEIAPMKTALLKEMGLTPSVLIRWAGAISVASALLFLAGALYGISILRERSRRRGPGSDLRRPRTMGGELRRLYFKTERNSVESPLSQLACSWLTEIKFQQTYTEGWSGSVKLVLGLEGGTNRARSLAQQQLTMPEIVDGFRGFLREAALSYTVIIGIDELDKIESDEDAFRFLNQIKSVFGIRGVFYLIAVSDNAMSNFERRGLPFRDAFDSSFDEIISVNHMNLATASQLLTERVIGMPVQFQALCYCLSGGLARELVRTCHDLVEQALLHGEYDLARLCARVVGVELRSRVYGIRIAAEKYSAEPQRTELLRLLLQVETALPVEEAELRSYGAALVDLAAAAESDGAEFDAVPSTPGRQEMPQRRDLPQLLRLAQEAGTFILFLAAIAHIFKDSLDEAAFRALQRDARFDLLARAYQALSVNPSLARRLIEAGSHSSCGGSEGL